LCGWCLNSAAIFFDAVRSCSSVVVVWTGVAAAAASTASSSIEW
jgi:hypothetical protein